MGRAIVDHLFPEGDAGRIPIVGVTGTNGKTVVARLIARLLYLSGKRTGLASEGLYLDRRLVQKGDRADFASGTRVLMNRNVDAAVIENDSSVILGQAWPTTAARSAWSPTSTTPTTSAISTSMTPNACSTSSARRWTWCCQAATRC